MNSLDNLGKQLLKYPNVCGYAKTLQNRQKKGRMVDELCLQIHVSLKLPEKDLRKLDIIPKSIEDIPIDVVFVGPLKALNLKKTDKIRPLVAGISIGNAMITAGTLGSFMEKTTSPNKGETFLGSNSHVFVDEPKNDTSLEKTILQPGTYDGGVEVVAEYYWHKKLFPVDEPSNCEVSKVAAGFLNTLSKIFGGKTRFIPVIQEINHIDFAVARPLVKWENKFFDVEFPPDKYKFAGFGYAGSDQVSLTCKSQYIKNEGYTPLGYDIADPHDNDVLHKTGRTSCHSQTLIITESVHEIVNFGAYNVEFDDVIMSGPFLEPGDSGSGAYLEL